MKRPRQSTDDVFDPDLADLPPELRWREWMNRVEVVLFASSKPVERGILERVVGGQVSIEMLIDDLVEELRGRPYEIRRVAGGWQMRTRPGYEQTMRAANGTRERYIGISPTEATVLVAIAYHQPITRGGVGEILGREVSRDIIGSLRAKGMIAAGPRSPTPGAPFTYVTTKSFLEQFGFDTLRDLPDIEALEDAGLLNQGNAGESFPIATENDQQDDD